jgi:hypothetical protein
MSAGLVGPVASTGRAGGVRLVEVPPRHIGGGNTRGAAAVWARPLSIWASSGAVVGRWSIACVIAVARADHGTRWRIAGAGAVVLAEARRDPPSLPAVLGGPLANRAATDLLVVVAGRVEQPGGIALSDVERRSAMRAVASADTDASCARSCDSMASLSSGTWRAGLIEGTGSRWSCGPVPVAEALGLAIARAQITSRRERPVGLSSSFGRTRG